MTRGIPAVCRFYAAVALASARGARLRPGAWARPETGHVCLCGAVLYAAGADIEKLADRNGKAVITAVAKKLKITLAQAASLNNGFEGEPFSGMTGFLDQNVAGAEITVRQFDRTWYTIGKTLRRHWQRTSGETE